MLPLALSQILDPTLTALGRLPARATLNPFQDETALRATDVEHRQSLDGTWRFQLLSQPAHAPQDWTTQDTSGAPWRNILVPGVWTRQNMGDLPHYANWQMPFACQKPPEVPIENPTGLYRTTFQTSDGQGSRRSILHIGGFESLALVWCNGIFIGMGKDSRLPSEFDLSEAVRGGENQLAIMVLRWCDATWIEDQDHWNHGGLHRSVWIESRAATHVQDLIVDTDYDPATQSGTAEIRAQIEGRSAGYVVSARVEDADGNLVAETQSAPVEQFDVTQSTGAQWRQSYSFDGYAASLRFEVPDAKPWSAEHPTRYRLVTQLQTPDGNCAEIHQTWIGFTRIETAGRRLRVNGQPIVLIGVNRHDHHPDNGKTCCEADIRAELITMKQHNINAIRAAHYPNDPVLLDLADELGLYLIDEANVECHARWTEVAQHSGYQAAIIERTVRMIARDRNHPCVIGWSLGNEAGHGPAHDAAAAAARHMDPRRFVHYEGAVSLRMSFPFGRSPETTQQRPSASETATTDVVCPMYPPVDHIMEWARWAEASAQDDRPLILCEFSHAMGNSNGSIAAYVDAFFAEPALAGGFVWDWRDQGLAETDEDGRFFWAYGGHYGDEPNDANFNINGLVGPDGTPHPALREYMWAARPVKCELLADGRVQCQNRRAFKDTRDLAMSWELRRDGVCVEDGGGAQVMGPGERKLIDIPIQTEISDDAEWHLSVQWSLNEQAAWAAPGHCLAWDQFSLNMVPASRPQMPPPQDSSDELAVEVSEQNGFSGVSSADQTLISSAITPCVWRAPTDNDGGKPGTRPLFQSKTSEWVRYGLNALTPGQHSLEQIEKAMGFRVVSDGVWTGEGGEALRHESTWTNAGTHFVIDETIIIPASWKDLPRIGVRFEVPSAYSRLEWFGLGPDESYPDRCGAQTVGVWSSTVADQYHPYVRPQEYGAHEQCRWFRLLDEAGNGLQVTLPQPLSFSARPHHDVDLNAAETIAELRPAETTEVHIDIGMRGLGTAACGPDALPEYLVGPGTYQFQWILQGVKGGG